MLARSPNRKAAVKYLAACGATPISVVDHDGVASITQARSQARRVTWMI
jgi:hypothetical protein